ncbi:MAG: peptide deformylase [Gammaproteobacteria bacterium]
MQPAAIIKVGDPILKSQSKVVANFGSKELYDLVEYLFYNMKYHGGVGIAAPQIGVEQRIFVYGFDENHRYPNMPSITKTVLINPEIYFFSDEQENFYEGCLSIPKIRGQVARAKNINVKAQSIEGNILDLSVAGFEARIIQHELDHLDGILFPMRMSDISTLIYTDN